MFNTKLNKLKISSFDIEEFLIIDREFAKNEHFKILENYIRKYCIDYGYTNKSNINGLIKNIKDLFEKLSFNGIFTNVDKDNEDSESESIFNPLKYYELNISGKSFTFLLLFNSFQSQIMVNVTYIYGISDQVIVNIDREIRYDSEKDNNNVMEALDLMKRSMSPRGMYYSLLSPLYQNHSPIYYSEHLLLMNMFINKIKNNEIEDIDSLKMIEIIGTLFKKFRYHYLNEEEKSKVDIEDLKFENGVKFDLERYNIEELAILNNIFNEKINVINKFNTMDNTMVDIKDLYSIICETVIDTILIESFDTKSYLDSLSGDNNYYSNEINEKVSLLMMQYFNYTIELLNVIFDLKLIRKFVKDNPLIQYKKYFPKEFIDTILNNSDIDKELNNTDVNRILSGSVKDQNEFNDVMETFEKIAQEENIQKEDIPEYNLIMDNIKVNKIVQSEMFAQYKQDFIKCISNLSLNVIFGRENLNRITFANIDRLFSITPNYGVNYLLNESDMYDAFNKINDSLRLKYHIEPTIENLKKYYSDFVDPIIQNINNTTDNITMLNESFSKMNFNIPSVDNLSSEFDEDDE